MSEYDAPSRVTESELGKVVSYDAHYNPKLLFPIARKTKREELGIDSVIPFTGFDLWTHYEVSWLNQKGKPIVALAEITYPCESAHIIESKSMKLYFNSLNQTKFKHIDNVKMTIERDLTLGVGMPVQVTLTDLSDATDQVLYARMDGICLDQLDIACATYVPNPKFLTTKITPVTETLFSNLLKSNCLITHQPDWGSIQIQYQGPQIDHEGLLQYLVSFRNHNEFHEQCIERIFVDIMTQCQPQDLVVYGRYTRRGGLDINVLRSKMPITLADVHKRLIRQ
ncbi:MAG: NADPH-dependent 7-cyano-7-deazaguanine reductase QueF [Legionella sp.]|nr:MAG: NADPH-dependent 7-cyano-7-deazaguanine reductase QueF [Legionella sp.]